MKENNSNKHQIIDKIFDTWADMSKYDVFYCIFGFLGISGTIGLVQPDTWWLAGFITFFSVSWIGILVLYENKQYKNKSEIVFISASVTTILLYVMWFVGQGVLWFTTKL